MSDTDEIQIEADPAVISEFTTEQGPEDILYEHTTAKQIRDSATYKLVKEWRESGSAAIYSHNVKTLKLDSYDFEEFILHLSILNPAIVCLQDTGQPDSVSERYKYMAGRMRGKGSTSCWASGMRGSDGKW